MLAGLASVALKYAHTDCRLVAPPESEYCSAKLWLAPDPEFGVTEFAVGIAAVEGTVQVPSVCQPLLEPDTSAAYM